MPTTTSLRAAEARRRRGKILRILQASEPLAISDPGMIYSMLDFEGESLSISQVHGLLRDLKERGYLRYEQRRTPESTLPEIRWIRFEPKGRDLVEGTITDPAVDLV